MTITDSPTTVRSADGTEIAIYRAGSGADRHHPDRPGALGPRWLGEAVGGTRRPLHRPELRPPRARMQR